MTDHRRILSKLKPRFSISCFNTVNDRASLIIEVEKKPYFSSVSLAL